MLLSKKPYYALQDLVACLSVDPTYGKAVYRAGHCYVALGHHSRAAKAFAKALPMLKGSATVKKHMETAQAAVAAQRDRMLKASPILTAMHQQREGMMTRDVKVGQPLFEFPDNVYTPRHYVDRKNKMHYSALLVYPLMRQTDFVQDWEEGASLADTLAMVLAKRPEWDNKGIYTPTTVTACWQR
ncbi:hypothetical protein KIPB_011908, partial [Kipferlia bialata]|eukprot:g11908.t1